MDNRPRIRDTAGRDQVLPPARPPPAPPLALARPRRRGPGGGDRLEWRSGWTGGGPFVRRARIRIAEVAAATWSRPQRRRRVIAANSPTLYAIAASTVNLKIVAGDKVAKGQALAVIDSPICATSWCRRNPTPAACRPKPAAPCRCADHAPTRARRSTGHGGAHRSDARPRRYQRAFAGGAVPQNDLARAKDER